MFVLSSVGIFFRLGEHVFFNTWWHMRVPVTDLMNSRGRGGECPPKTSNPFLGPCVWILVYKKPNFPGLFQTSEFRCLFLRPLWYEDTLSWTIDFATWNAHPPHPTNPLQCNAYPSLGPYTFLEFLYAYTKCIAAQRTKDFFFSLVDFHQRVKMNSIIAMCPSTEKQLRNVTNVYFCSKGD